MKDYDASIPARELSKLGASKGGRARARKLTHDERSEIARLAAEKRWARFRGVQRDGMLRETHPGVLTIGDKQLPCAVLHNGTRVFSTRGITRAVGGKKTGSPERGAPLIPPFLTSASIRRFISPDLRARLESPIPYKPKHGGVVAFGYEATLLPQICEAILDADKASALKTNQKHLTFTAEILMRGFARVGIIALVDEATGYQQERARDELNRILEAYIARELLPWTKRFPDEFFQNLHRIYRWQYREGYLRPKYVGKLVNRLVYQRLPPGVLQELKRRNPPTEKGYRKYKHHQFLTRDVGHPHLHNHILAVTTLMRISDDKATFKRYFEKAFPSPGQQLLLEFPVGSHKPSDSENEVRGDLRRK